MLNRKEFLHRSFLAAIAGSLGIKATAKNIRPFSSGFFDSGNLPVTIATWKNEKATEAAMDILVKGGTSLDAVEAGARVPEADPEDTSVGYGGFPDRDGNVTLDAAIMDHKGNAGSVTFLQHIMHPISVARLVMEKTPHVMLSGEGALQFALANGFKKENLLTEKSKKAWEDWKKESNYTPSVNEYNHDTIGILAIDSQNNIAGACSTSGWAFKMHGRVGDSPIIGAGMFVDNEVGGAAATGTGELMMKTLGSFLIVELMRNGRKPQEAVEEAIHRIQKKYDVADKQVGYIAINKSGGYGAYSLREDFSYTLNRNGENKVFDSKFSVK